MIGMMVLGAVALWVIVAVWIARRVARAIPMKASARPWAAAGLFVVFFLLPVGDELAARPFFERWCHERAVLHIDAQRIKGRTVRVLALIANERLKSALIPTFHSKVAYVDANSGEVLADYETLEGGGGALGRAIGFPPGHSITGTFYCRPTELEMAREKYGFVEVN
jgi:hypothetical protein